MRRGTHVCVDPRGDTEHITNCDLSWNEARPKTDRSFLLFPAILQRNEWHHSLCNRQAKAAEQKNSGQGDFCLASRTLATVPVAHITWQMTVGNATVCRPQTKRTGHKWIIAYPAKMEAGDPRRYRYHT
jgi:hypothetical protein